MQGNIIVKYRGISYNKRPPPPLRRKAEKNLSIAQN